METNEKREKIKWLKGIYAFESPNEAAECVARTLFLIAKKNPNSSIILPTDRSAAQIFLEMINLSKDYEECPFYDAHIISDTETLAVTDKHKASRARRINEKLLTPLRKKGKDPAEDHVHLLSGIYTETDDPLITARRVVGDHEPSVHAISISPRGEILAYDINTYKEDDHIEDDMPRILRINDDGKTYIDPDQPTNLIVSIGLGTSLSADTLIIIIFGTEKADILNKIAYGPQTASIPATLLRLHQNAFVVTTSRIAQMADISEFTTFTDNMQKTAEEIALHKTKKADKNSDEKQLTNPQAKKLYNEIKATEALLKEFKDNKSHILNKTYRNSIAACENLLPLIEILLKELSDSTFEYTRKKYENEIVPKANEILN